MSTPQELDLGGLTIRGISVAGVQTCIEVPSWKLCFDIGKGPSSAVRYRRVFFTHGHVDHTGGVAHHCGTRAMRRQPPPTYYIGRESAAALDAVVQAFRQLDQSVLPCAIVGLEPGDDVPVAPGRRVVAFRSVHRVPTLGYALVEERRKLREDLRGRPLEELAAVRARGESIHDRVQSVELAFCGDTTIEVVEREPLVRQARRLILEVTFLDDAVSEERARATGHIHLDQICERADLFENEAILFTHFSLRYRASQIERILARRLPVVLRDRVQALLAGFAP